MRTQSNVTQSTTKAEKENAMSTKNLITTALTKATRRLRYPGPWAEYQGQPLDEFLLELGDRPAVPDQTPWGRLIFREPLKDALAAMPYVYRGTTQQIIAQYFFDLMKDGASEIDVERVCELVHENLTMTRSLLAARIKVDLGEEFAKGTTPIQIVESKPWQADASYDEGDASFAAEDFAYEVGQKPKEDAPGGETMWVSCGVDQVVQDFAEALRQGREDQSLNWANSLLIAIGGEQLAEIEWSGWDKVAIDRQFDAEAKKKLADQFKSNDPSKRWWAVNKGYRALVKTKRSLESSLDYWTWRLDQAKTKNEGTGPKNGPRPNAEAYAGEDELVEIGRINHVLGAEGYDMDGNREGWPEQEVVDLVEAELVDLNALITQLEDEQRKVECVWQAMGHKGVPYWYQRTVKVVNGERVEQYKTFSIDEKAEAEVAMAEQREIWLKGRMGEQIKTLTDAERRMLAELARFDDAE